MIACVRFEDLTRPVGSPNNKMFRLQPPLLPRSPSRRSAKSPGFATGVSLEGTDQLRCDPAAVELAGLRSHASSTNPALQVQRVEGHTVGERLCALERLRIGPRDPRQSLIAPAQRPVAGWALPFAVRGSRSAAHQLRIHILPGQVKAGGMRCLEHLEGVAGTRNLKSAPANNNLPRLRADNRWSRIIPHRNLARSG